MAPKPILSRRFQVAEFTSWNIPGDDPARWTPVPITDQSPRVKGNKWIYFFRQSVAITGSAKPAPPRPGTASVLHRACFADASGNLSVLSPADVQRAGDVEPNPADRATGDSSLSLEDTLAEDTPAAVVEVTQFFYYIYVSHIWLSSSSRADLALNISKFAPATDLPDQVFVEVNPAPAAIGGLDVITVATGLHAAYLPLADTLIKSIAETAESSDAQRKAVQERAMRTLMAESLKAIIDGDANDDLKISSRKDVKAKAEQFLKDSQAAEKNLRDSANDSARKLSRWLLGPAWLTAEAQYVSREVDTFHIWIKANAAVTTRLIESDPGKFYFDKLLDVQPTLIKNYLLRDTNADEAGAQFQAFRKADDAGTALWMNIVPFIIRRQGLAGGRLLAAAIRRITGENFFDVVEVQSPFPMQNKALTRSTNVQVTHLKFKPGAIRRKELEKVFYPGSTALNGLNSVVEFLNFTGSLDATAKLFDANDKTRGDKIIGSINMLGDTTDLAIALQVGKVIGKKAAAIVGIIGAVCDMICAADSAITAFKQGNMGQGIGQVFIFFGSAGMGLSCILLFVGSARAGLVGIIAAAVILTGAIIVAIFTDSDMEVFARHTLFGPRHLKDSLTPTWSTTNVNTWTDDLAGLKNQIDALARLAFAYSIETAGPRSIGIRCGEGLPDSVFLLEFFMTFTAGITFNPKIMVHPGGKVKTADRPVLIESSGQGNMLIFGVDFPNRQPPLPADRSVEVKLVRCRITAQFDVFGDQTVMMPSKAPLDIITFENGIVEADAKRISTTVA